MQVDFQRNIPGEGPENPEVRSAAKKWALRSSSLTLMAATLSQALAALTNPNTNAIKAAEDVLRPFLKKKACVKAIVQQAGECPNPVVRQLAATVHRKPIAKLWKKLKPEVQAQVKAMLIESRSESYAHTDSNERHDKSP